MEPNYLQYNLFNHHPHALLYNQALEKLHFWAKSALWFPVALWVAGTVPNHVGKENASVVTYSLGYI